MYVLNQIELEIIISCLQKVTTNIMRLEIF